MGTIENAAAALLIVDDNEDNREILAGRLAQLGYTNIAMASGGREALERIERSAVDLVLLDVMMPVIGGIEVLETLHAKHRLASLPVIMVTRPDLPEAPSVATVAEAVVWLERAHGSTSSAHTSTAISRSWPTTSRSAAARLPVPRACVRTRLIQ